MSELREQIAGAVRFIRGRAKAEPEIGIILGTGLGALADDIDAEAVISYDEIPHFPISTVEFHAGRLILGRLSGKRVVAMQGRFHRYEGYSLQQITFPVRVMRALGADTLIVSTACGAMNDVYQAGDIMLIIDHINLLGDNPLIGPNDDELGPRYPDMSEAYNRNLLALAEEVARGEDIVVRKGVYAILTGPNLETSAEYRFLRIVGADVVGMSTVPENIVAVHGGMRVLGLAVVTDVCHPGALEKVDIAAIVRAAEEAEPRLTRIIKGVVERI